MVFYVNCLSLQNFTCFAINVQAIITIIQSEYALNKKRNFWPLTLTYETYNQILTFFLSWFFLLVFFSRRVMKSDGLLVRTNYAIFFYLFSFIFGSFQVPGVESFFLFSWFQKQRTRKKPSRNMKFFHKSDTREIIRNKL